MPTLLVNYETDVTFDANVVATGGNVKWCSADGNNCVFGQLSNFRSGTSVGDFTNRTLSTTQVTGGTGVYAGATGSWEADAYSVPSFDQSQNLPGYSLVAFLDGNITFTDTTTPPPTNNGGGGGGGGCTLDSKAEFDPIMLVLMFSALIYLGLRKLQRVII